MEEIGFPLGVTGLLMAKRLLQHRPGDIMPCTTRIQRMGRNLPWNEQIAIHPMPNGSIEMKALRPDTHDSKPPS